MRFAKLHSSDAANETDANGVVQFAIESFGQLDILVNNAATIIYRPLLEMSLAEWNRILSVNLIGNVLRDDWMEHPTFSFSIEPWL